MLKYVNLKGTVVLKTGKQDFIPKNIKYKQVYE